MVEPLWVKLRPYREMVLGNQGQTKNHGLRCGCMTTWASSWPQHLWLTALSMPHPAIHTRPYPFWGRGYNSTQATSTLTGALASCFPWSVYTFLQRSSHLFTHWCDLMATILIHLSNLLNISFSCYHCPCHWHICQNCQRDNVSKNCEKYIQSINYVYSNYCT
jgi:hypothetical protein